MVVERGQNQIQHEGMNTMNGSALLCAVFENGGKGAKFSSSSSGYVGLKRQTFFRATGCSFKLLYRRGLEKRSLRVSYQHRDGV